MRFRRQSSGLGFSESGPSRDKFPKLNSSSCLKDSASLLESPANPLDSTGGSLPLRVTGQALTATRTDSF